MIARFNIYRTFRCPITQEFGTVPSVLAFKTLREEHLGYIYIRRNRSLERKLSHHFYLEENNPVWKNCSSSNFYMAYVLTLQTLKIFSFKKKLVYTLFRYLLNPNLQIVLLLLHDFENIVDRQILLLNWCIEIPKVPIKLHISH
jgi:hypothetical protein